MTIRCKYVGYARIKHHRVQPHDQRFDVHSLHPGQGNQNDAPPGSSKASSKEILVAPARWRTRIKRVEAEQIVAASQRNQQQAGDQYNRQVVFFLLEIAERKTEDKNDKVED